MAEVFYFDINAPLPFLPDDASWIFVQEQDGNFIGTGGAWKPSGEWVGYCSLAEDDVNLQLALEAAQEWAACYNVPIIWVFASGE